MPKTTTSSVVEKLKAVLESKGAILIAIETGRKVTYLCSCGNNAHSYTPNILKPKWKGCIKCSNQKRGNHNDFDMVKQVFKENCIDLPTQPYKGNKSKLYYTCPECGEEAHVSLSELRRGRRCEKCARSRSWATNLKTIGVENQFQAPDFKTKCVKTNLERYGVEHPMQNPKILSKNLTTSFRRKPYTFPSGRIELVLGYEPVCLDYLLSNGYSEDELIVNPNEMPIIWYDNRRTGKVSRYYPDIYIPSKNLLVEVKSDWTY